MIAIVEYGVGQYDSDWNRIDGRTVERTGDSIEQLLVG